jgi:glycerophosphoryl diester phosphodiesterase
VNIDPKAGATVAPLVELVGRMEAWDRVGIGAFSDARIAEVRRLSGGRACTSMGPRAIAAAAASAASAGRMRRMGADCLQVPPRVGSVPLVTRRFVDAAHRAGLAVQVWTINDAPAMEALLDLGVDGIMTDELATLADVFRSRSIPLGGIVAA